MEKTKQLQIFLAIRTIVHKFTAPHLTMNRLWRILLSCFGFAVVAIATTAFFVYQWAYAIPDIVAPTRIDQNYVSVTQLRELNAYYLEKQKIFKELVAKKPVAPSLGKGIGEKVDEEVLTPSSEAELTPSEKKVPSPVFPKSRVQLIP